VNWNPENLPDFRENEKGEDVRDFAKN
jgi:hypothetical protein